MTPEEKTPEDNVSMETLSSILTPAQLQELAEKTQAQQPSPTDTVYLQPVPERQEWSSDKGVRIARIVFGIIFIIYLYLLPTGIGMVRDRRPRNFNSIILMNIFLGWTIVGWVVALVWVAQDNNR